MADSKKIIYNTWNTYLKPFLTRNNVEIYTDGAVKNEKGAWSFLVLKKGKIINQRVSQTNITDCNQMELQAAIEALKVLQPKTKGTLYSDSRILIDSVTLWMNEWRQNNWVKKKGYPLPYAEQLKELDALNARHKLEWRWIRGHSGNPFNDHCDQLCREALQNNKLQEDLRKFNK